MIMNRRKFLSSLPKVGGALGIAAVAGLPEVKEQLAEHSHPLELWVNGTLVKCDTIGVNYDGNGGRVIQFVTRERLLFEVMDEVKVKGALEGDFLIKMWSKSLPDKFTYQLEELPKYSSNIASWNGEQWHEVAGHFYISGSFVEHGGYLY